MSKTTSTSERHGHWVGSDPAVGAAECSDRGAILSIEREAEDIEIFAQALAPRGLRDDDKTFVEMPSDDHLRRRASMLGGNRGDHGIAKYLSAPQERPGLGGDAMRLMEIAHLA